MKRLRICLLASALAVVTNTAFAESTAPDMVKMDDGEVAMSLTGSAGDATKGREVFSNRKLGNCLACHQNSEMTDFSFHGEVGPPLDGVADRWEEPQLRAILVNSKAVLGDETIMPSFYRLKNGERTAEKFADKTILTAEQVEDVLAYLQTLKE